MMEKQPQNVRDLIYFFTHNKNLTRQQQARRDKLLTRDCIAIDTRTETNSESQELLVDQGDASTKSDENKVTKVRYISPKNLHSFLYDFNQNNVLKYTCHEIDTDEVISEINELCDTKKYIFKKHSNLISQALESLLNDFKRQKIYLDYKFVAMLKAYILGNNDKGWSSLGIKTTWKSDDLLAWSEQHEGAIPSPGKNIAKKQKDNGYKLSKSLISNINGTRVLYFKDLVTYFKSLFHIRRDNSLRKIIEYQNKKLEDINVIFKEDQFNDGIELLTDVDKLIQAYKSILKICKDANNGEILNIELGFYESNDSVLLTIHDSDHCYGKTLKSTLERIGESQSKLIKNQINGLCNLYIEADFGNNEYAKVGLWTKESTPLGDIPKMSVEPLSEAKGVKYILEFNWK